MAKQKTIKSYSEAYKELNQILSKLESDEVDIDNLTADIKRAADLVKYCQDRLREIDKELNKDQ